MLPLPLVRTATASSPAALPLSVPDASLSQMTGAASIDSTSAGGSFSGLSLSARQTAAAACSPHAGSLPPSDLQALLLAAVSQNNPYNPFYYSNNLFIPQQSICSPDEPRGSVQSSSANGAGPYLRMGYPPTSSPYVHQQQQAFNLAKAALMPNGMFIPFSALGQPVHSSIAYPGLVTSSSSSSESTKSPSSQSSSEAAASLNSPNDPSSPVSSGELIPCPHSTSPGTLSTSSSCSFSCSSASAGTMPARHQHLPTGQYEIRQPSLQDPSVSRAQIMEGSPGSLVDAACVGRHSADLDYCGIDTSTEASEASADVEHGGKSRRGGEEGAELLGGGPVVEMHHPQPGQRFVDEAGNVYEYVLEEDEGGDEELVRGGDGGNSGEYRHVNILNSGMAESELMANYGILLQHPGHGYGIGGDGTVHGGWAGHVNQGGAETQKVEVKPRRKRGNSSAAKRDKSCAATGSAPKTNRRGRRKKESTLLGQLLNSENAAGQSTNESLKNNSFSVPLTTDALIQQLTSSCFPPFSSNACFDYDTADVHRQGVNTPSKLDSPSPESPEYMKFEPRQIGNRGSRASLNDCDEPSSTSNQVKMEHTCTFDEHMTSDGPSQQSPCASDDLRQSLSLEDFREMISTPLDSLQPVDVPPLPQEKKRSRVGRRRPNNPESGYPGVSWNCRMQAWLAFFVDHMGTRRSRTFKCNKLGGLEKARQTAVEWLMNKNAYLKRNCKPANASGDYVEGL
eukprot:GHVQ01033209.1.p1 GENE.GHVQ01033209.1~~GHVQ01033209.1.p1  ORF type:complete len:737 (+),score=118.04 GHVQ01033209.1:448-2658(+)